MSHQTNCKNCGAAIPANAPAGICPKCTFGMAIGPQAPPAETLAPTAMGGSFVAPRPEDLQGRIENLEILEMLGHGGMGAVYKARQKNLDRIVALKILSPSLTNDPSFAQRFTREARTLARLTHPNIVMVFEFGTVDDLHYLLMEFVDGVDLRTAMRDGTLQSDQALVVVQQVCEALQYAHDEGIVHRDIKPENILLGLDGKVKIADFGLAKLVQNEPFEHSITGTQQVVGTRNYMAPEQIETPNQVDHRADIYSLGVVFYELLTGELPLGRFAAPSEKAQVNARLDDVVLRALEKEPGRRYQQASQVRTAVESIENHPEAARAQATAANRAGQPARFADATVLRVPFSIPNLYGGFAKAHGIAHFDGAHFELELEIKDEVFGAIKSRPQRIDIPLADLFEAEFKGTLSGAGRMVFTAAHLDSVDQVPNNKQGQFILHVKKDNRRQAEEFTAAIADAIRSGPGPVRRQPRSKSQESARPWRKAFRDNVFVFGIGSRHYRKTAESPLPNAGTDKEQMQSPLPGNHDEAERNMRGPALGLLATGILNALIAVGLLISFLAGTISWVDSLTDYSPPDPPQTTTVATSDGESVEVSTAADVSTAVQISTNEHSKFLPLRWSRGLFSLLENFSLGTFIVSAAMAVLLVFASLRMLMLKDHQFCVFASVMAVIPLHGAAPLGIGFGIWALVMLNRPEIREAFTPSSEPLTGGSAPPTKGDEPESDNAFAQAMRAPTMVFLQIFKTILVVGVCLVFSFGLILLITKLAAMREGSSRPEFGDSVTALTDRIDEFDEQFDERIDRFEETLEDQPDSTAGDQINRDLEKEFAALEGEINELRKSAKSAYETAEITALSAQLNGYRNGIRSQIQAITDSGDDGAD